jgi:hypothetical protein
MHTSGASRRGNAELHLNVIARSGSDEAIQFSSRKAGLLRFARNDGLSTDWLFEN